MNAKEAIEWLEDREIIALLGGERHLKMGKWMLRTLDGTYYGDSIVEVVNKASKAER